MAFVLVRGEGVLQTLVTKHAICGQRPRGDSAISKRWLANPNHNILQIRNNVMWDF